MLFVHCLFVVIFSAPDGEMMKEVYNEGGNPSYKFYYTDAKSSKYQIFCLHYNKLE
jgi:hypothetical protein